MQGSWMDSVARKRLGHESSHRLQRIIDSGPGHRDYHTARTILAERATKQAMAANPEVGTTGEELDALLEELPAQAEVAPSPHFRDYGHLREMSEEKCTHTMTPIVGVERLFGSSYRGGVSNKGTVAVIMTPEALPLVIRPGWTSVGNNDAGIHGAFSAPAGEIIYWPWRDMSVPTDNLDAVKKIVALHLLHKQGRTIEVACFGGHGRTGTLLAVLAALARDWPAVNAVAMLRDFYCRKAVETDEQARWVAKAVQAVRIYLHPETAQQII